MLFFFFLIFTFVFWRLFRSFSGIKTSEIYHLCQMYTNGYDSSKHLHQSCHWPVKDYDLSKKPYGSHHSPDWSAPQVIGTPLVQVDK